MHIQYSKMVEPGMTHRVSQVGLQPSETRETSLSFSTAARYRHYVAKYEQVNWLSIINPRTPPRLDPPKKKVGRVQAKVGGSGPPTPQWLRPCSTVHNNQTRQLSGTSCVLNLVPAMTPKYPKMRLIASSVPKFAQGSHQALK
jgi:hypothetical protein